MARDEQGAHWVTVDPSVTCAGEKVLGRAQSGRAPAWPRPLRTETRAWRRGCAHARNAVAIAFAANGFAFANWAARIPAIRDEFSLSPGQVGPAAARRPRSAPRPRSRWPARWCTGSGRPGRSWSAA